MKRKVIILALLLGLSATQEQTSAASPMDVVLRWAPVISQQDNGKNSLARENVFTEVNYDNDWRANNNSQNLPYYSPDMAAYYSIVESDKHYFIGYYFYYPRHVGTTPHEHDMIGTMAAVRKDPKGTGRLDMLLTYSNKQWRKWDGSGIRQENGRPVLTISAGTHEIMAIQSTVQMIGADRVYPVISGVLGQVTSGRTAHAASYAGYRLVDINELWQRRHNIGQGNTFGRWGFFNSYYYQNSAAPWAWEYKQANWLANPAELVQLVRGTSAEPEAYMANPYD